MGWLEDYLNIPENQPAPNYLASLGQPPPPFDVGQFLGAQQQTPAPAAPIATPEPTPLKPPKQPKLSAYEQQSAEAAATQALAVQKQADAEAAKQAEISARASAEAMRSFNAQHDIEEERQRTAAEIDQRQQELLAEASKVNGQKIDPGKGIGPGAIIATAVMGFLSGFMNPKGGAQDVAAMVQRIIQRNVDKQLANQEQQNKILGFKQSALNSDAGRQQQNLDNRLRAEASAYDTAMKTITAQAARFDSPVVQAKAQQLLGQIQQQQIDRVQDWRDKRQQLAMQKSQVALGWADLSERQRQFNVKASLEFAKDAQDKAAKAGAIPEGALLNTGDPRGFSPLTSTAPAVLTKALEVKKGTEEFINYNQLLLKAYRDHPGKEWDNFLVRSEGKQLMENLGTNMAVSWSLMHGQGAQGEAEAKRVFEKVIGGDLGTWFRRASPSVLEQNISTSEANYNNFMKTVSPGFGGGYRWSQQQGKWYVPSPSEQKGTLGADYVPTPSVMPQSSPSAFDQLFKPRPGSLWSHLP